MTLTEQILARAAGRTVTPGDEVWARVDLAVMHDSSGPRRIAPVLAEVGNRIWDPSRVVVATDHFTPAANVRHAAILRQTRQWAKEFGIGRFFDEAGILHNLLLEKGIVTPGMLVVGADSHICTVGVHGAFTVGVGSTELAMVLATGEIWLEVPRTVLIRLEGERPAWITARDITMTILGRLKADFALDRAVEFDGTALSSLSMDERTVLTNQGVEMGAVAAMVVPDARTYEYMSRLQARPAMDLNRPDPSGYEQVHTFDVGEMVPMVACPPRVDQTRPAAELGDVALDRAYLGSCAGGKLADLQAAAALLKGRRVSIPLTVVPATRQVYEEALRTGVLETLLAAGATIHAPGCGACAGLHSGLLGPQERCITTATRNFPGRMGDPTAEIYLASPLTVAASAVAGRIADPREYLGKEAAA